MILLTTGLTLAGCALLALSQDHNWKLVTGTAPIGRTQLVIRVGGWVLPGASLVVGIAVEDPGFAVVTWMLQLAVACFVVAMTLGFHPGLLRLVARTCSGYRRISSGREA